MTNPVFKNINIPPEGNVITFENGSVVSGNNPIIPFIEGDGIGIDIWPASKLVLDSAVKIAYGEKKKINWVEILAGEKAYNKTGEWLSKETIEAIKHFKVAIKGPLTTPIGGGIRSLNVTLRQELDLYACVRPIKYFKGVPSPVKNPELLNIVIFRENTEDVYSGVEFKQGTQQCEKLLNYLKTEFNANIKADSGLGIKPISKNASKRIIRRAIQYAIEHKKSSVTIVHKGNIMKFTEGAFMKWGYELAQEEFKDIIITEKDLYEQYKNKLPDGKIIIKDCIADAMFMNILKWPNDYDIIVTTNLNGDYLSDACAAQVGGLGLAPGSNMSDEIALYEATHGTAPKFAGLDKLNPSSLILSGVMMLEHLGWYEAANIVNKSIEQTIDSKIVTCDLEMENAHIVKCSEFANEIVKNMYNVL